MYSNPGGYAGSMYRGKSIGANPSFTGTLQALANNDSLAIGSTGYVGWVSRTIIRSSVDGNILLTNNAATAFGLMQFGGTTSSFPALKVNGVNLQARLADDSNFTTFQALSISLASVGQYIFGANSKLSSPSDGIILLQNNAGSTFSRLQFGGTTSSFPALDVQGATLRTVLADGSVLAGHRAAWFLSNTAAPVGGVGEIIYGATTATTVGAAGAASALPTAPVGYIIINVAGTQMKLPYYNT